MRATSMIFSVISFNLRSFVSQPIEIFARCANFPGQAISQKIKSREDAKTRSREDKREGRQFNCT